MTRSAIRRSVRVVIGGAAAIALLSGCQSASSSKSTSASTAPTTSATARTTTTSEPTTTTAPGGPAPASSFGIQVSPCSYGQQSGTVALPDPHCTPGATNPAVTQATIGSTICASGYSSTIRPPESVTYPEKRASMVAYGQSGSTSGYEYDHLVSLEVGGAANAAANLWPEPYAGSYGARVKDRLENRLHQLICSGALPLATAQAAEASNWVVAYNTYVGPLP